MGSVNLTGSKGGASVSVVASVVLDMAGDDLEQSTQLIGTAAELITFGEIAGAPAMFAVVNLDTVNFVEIAGAADMSGLKLKLLPGVPQLISPASAVVYAKANAAPVRIWKGAVSA